MTPSKKLFITLMSLSSIEILASSYVSGVEATVPYSAKTSFFKRHKGACLTAGLFVGSLVLYYAGKTLSNKGEGSLTENKNEQNIHPTPQQTPEKVPTLPPEEQLETQPTNRDNIITDGHAEPQPENGTNSLTSRAKKGQPFAPVTPTPLPPNLNETFVPNPVSIPKPISSAQENSEKSIPTAPQISPRSDPIPQPQAQTDQNDSSKITITDDVPLSEDVLNKLYGPKPVDVLCVDLKTITMGQFSTVNCKKLVLTENVEEIGRDAFKYSEIEEIDMTRCNKLKEIGPFAFSGTQIQSVTLPSSVETIGSQAFQSCSKLTDVFVSASFDPLSDSNKKSSSVFANTSGKLKIQPHENQNLDANWENAQEFIGRVTPVELVFQKTDIDDTGKTE